MSGNKIGEIFSLTTFGESHSPCIGGVIEGVPCGLEIDLDFIQRELDRRKSQANTFSTPRQEADTVEFLSGLEGNIAQSSPLSFIIKNTDVKAQEYDYLRGMFRPSHADYTYYKKYGVQIQSGAGRASGRETATRVVGGAVAKLLLRKYGIKVQAKIQKIGQWDYTTQIEMIDQALSSLKARGESLGGVVSCSVQGVPCGLGEPVFDKINAQMAKAQMSIPSARAFEMGDGFEGCGRYGSEELDHWCQDFSTQTNHCGGVQGGITNGMSMEFKVGFKPIATLQRKEPLIDIQGELKDTLLKGRMDCCIVPRVLVVVEAMAALTVADFLLRNKLNDKNKK